MKKVLCLLVVFVMIISMAACAKSEKEPKDTGSATTTAATEVNPFEEFMEITWLCMENANYEEGGWAELEIEEKFNVDIKIWPMDSNNTEQMAALVAAGDIADYNEMRGGPRSPVDMYLEGLTRSIPLQAIKDHLPGMYRLLEMMPIGFKYNLVPGTTDEYLGLTHVGFGSAQYFYETVCINLDWLEAIGYTVDNLKPVKIATEGYEHLSENIFVGEGNFTFEEYNDILRKFTEDDPDGNGEDDTYGMMYFGENAWTNQTQEGLFGFVHEANYLYKDPVTGNIVPKYAYTPYRDYLAWLSEMLGKGYIRRTPGQESWVNEYSAISATNKVGVMQAHRDGYLQLTSDLYRNYPPQNILLGVDPDARFVLGPMFKGPEGIMVDCTYSIDTFGTGLSRVDMIGNQVSDEKLARILAIFQYTIYTSEELFNRYHIGIEGIHWKWAGEPYKSAKITTPQANLDPEYRGHLRTFTGWLMQWPTAQMEIDNALNDGYWSVPAYMYAYDLHEKYACVPEKYISEIYMGTDLYKKYVELNAEINPQITPIVNDFKSRALKGEIANFNTEWSQYIDQLYSAGLQKLIDEIFNNPEYEKFNPGDKFKIKGPLY